ncbi:DinB family protein [Pseudonocardiaceae bacterium YIM PH 21723]|nr:DinB family protein [Pseudonocardiaceae bacterium YIM PH 21723]
MKETLHRNLKTGRDALVWKLDGLSDYDVRRPLTSTGTNLLGLVKHVGGAAAGYFGLVFGRPVDLAGFGWTDPSLNLHMYATADESRDQIVTLWTDAWKLADATIEELAIDAPGLVPWWPEEHNRITLGDALVHMIGEVQRHAGHADIVRELIDNASGHSADVSYLPEHDAQWWAAHHAKLQGIADSVSS